MRVCVPFQEGLGLCDVGPASARVVRGQVLEHDLRLGVDQLLDRRGELLDRVLVRVAQVDRTDLVAVHQRVQTLEAENEEGEEKKRRRNVTMGSHGLFVADLHHL